MSGLGSVTFTIPVSGTYNIKCDLTEVPASSVAIVITQNESTVYTAPAITPSQSALQFKFDFLATAADAMVVTLSSGAAIDNALNNIKSIISIGQGL